MVEIFISFSVILLAVVFCAAGVAKIRAVDTLEGVVQNFRILPAGLARPFALALPPAEIAVAAALVMPASRSLGAAAAAGLLLVFTLAIAINLFRGRREIDCGCFNSDLKQNLSGWLVGRNLVLTAIAGGLMLIAPGVHPAWAAWLLGSVGVGVAILVYFAATTLASNTAIVAQRRAVAAGNF